MQTCFRVQVASALQHVHAKRMAHLDVKPDNIYTDPDSDMVKLGDFGLATPLNHQNLAVDISEGDCRSAAASCHLLCVILYSNASMRPKFCETCSFCCVCCLKGGILLRAHQTS